MILQKNEFRGHHGEKSSVSFVFCVIGSGLIAIICYSKLNDFVRVEKDKIQIQAEIGDVRCATEEVHRSQASAEKQNKNLLLSLNDVNKRIEEHNCNMVNLEAVRRRLTTENADLLSQLQVR